MFKLTLLFFTFAVVVQLAVCGGWKPCIKQGESCPSDSGRYCCSDLHCDQYTISCLPSW
nr:venom peptide [Acharia stimulea]